MQQYSCFDGQTFLDVCLNTYGSLDYFIKLLNDNGIAPESIPQSGQIITWDNSLVENQSVLNTIKQKNVIFATKPNGLNYLLTENGYPILTEYNEPILV